MSERLNEAAEGVLAANEAFYSAFGGRDLEAMEELWATTAPVACIHPGRHALRGRDLVIASWRSILGSGDTPPVVSSNASVHVLGETAFVICEEHLGHAILIATNVFIRERNRWKLVHHQSAPVATDAFESPLLWDEDGPTLN